MRSAASLMAAALVVGASASVAFGQTAQTAASDVHAEHAHMAAQAASQPPAGGAPAPGPGAQPPATPPPPTPAVPKKPDLPADEAGAKEAIAKTPRHTEYVDVKVEGLAAPIKTFVVYPERKDKAPVIIVIQEIFGLSDWIKGVADQLAQAGFIAVAPDLLSGKGPNGGGTEAFASRDEVVAAVRTLTPKDVVAALNAVRAYGTKLPSANGKSGSVGFCWGGGMSFLYATAQPELNAAVVYYGTSPSADALASIKAPVLGLYGGNDARVNATIEPASAELKKLGKSYEPHIYDGAGHGFLRQQGGQNGANLKATEQAWPATIAFLKQHTK
jgi:carboxymethylenebutenolidase